MNKEENKLSENIHNLINKIMIVETKLYSKKEKYPNLHKAWNTTLIFKIKKMLDVLNHCEYFCDNIDSTIKEDIPIKTLALMYILNNNYLNK